MCRGCTYHHNIKDLPWLNDAVNEYANDYATWMIEEGGTMETAKYVEPASVKWYLISRICMIQHEFDKYKESHP